MQPGKPFDHFSNRLSERLKRQFVSRCVVVLLHGNTMHEGKSKVLSKFDKEKSMSPAALTSSTRSALGALVEREERRVGSRTVAYEIVAQSVGISSSWVKKFLSSSHEVKEPRITLFHNIRAAYDQLCERVELENRADEDRLRALKGQIHAVTEGMGEEAQTQISTVVGDAKT